MIQLLLNGGLFMLPLLLLALVMVVLAARVWSGVLSQKVGKDAVIRTNFMVLQIGIFSFFLGLFSQVLGLMQAFKVIQEVGAVAPQMLAGGLYMSLIAPGFGLAILLFALGSWSACKWKLHAYAQI